MESLSLLIKPASGACNLNCTYCFYQDLINEKKIKVHKVMNFNTLEKLLTESLSLVSKNLILSFQGGEPLLAGLSYYEKLIKLVRKLNTKNINIIYSMQTNGTLLNKAWARFLKEHNFLVGLSLDGPKALHDRARRGESGSFSKAMQALSLLKEFDIEFNILCVVTKQNFKDIKKTYNFFKEQNLRFLQFIPCIMLHNKQNYQDFVLSNEEYLFFLEELFSLWKEDIKTKDPISIRYFDNIIAILLNLPANSCDINQSCGKNLVVEANGDFYPCDFYVEENYLLGNINKDKLVSIYKSLVLKGFQNNSKAPAECMNCPYLFLCYGGCQRYRNPNYIYCETIKSFMEKNKTELIAIRDLFLKH